MHSLTLAEVFLESKNFTSYNDRTFERRLDAEQTMRNFDCRGEYLPKFGFAIPTMEAILEIAKLSPLLDIGAGCGYLTFELGKAGADCTAIDTQTGKYAFNNEPGHWTEFWTKIHKMPAIQAIRRCPTMNLLFSWPDYEVAWPSNALQATKCEYVAYIGEGAGGCTGNLKFHTILDTEFEGLQSIDLPKFFGLHDNLTIYRRK